MPSIRLALLGGALVMTGNAGPAHSLIGQWSAPGANLTVGPEGARLEQDCATGSFGPVQVSSSGHFKTTGSFEAYQPGPQRADESPGGNAVFDGLVEGDTLRLTIRPAGGSPQELTLMRGKRAKLIRCY